MLDAFVAVPEHRTTRALADALRGWGDRMRARDDIPAARAAYARAYAAAQGPAAERAILGDFVRLFHEQWSWDQLGTLCELLARQDPQSPWSGRCAEAAFARRDFHAVTEAHARSPGDATLADLAPLAAAWAEATPLGHDVIGAGTLPGPGQAPRELYLHVDSPAPGRLDVVRPTPRLPVVRSYALPSRFAPRLRPLSLGPDKPPLLVTWSATHRRVSLSAAGPERLAELVSVTADEPLGADVADLDGDGQQEVYVGTGPYGRVLLSFRPLADGTWRIDHPHPETDATNSDISAVLAADLDGDGAQELALAAGPWRAFDVRVLRPGKGRALELVARRKLGAVVGLATLRAADGERLLVAAKTDGYPSKVAFSASDPAGPPAGVYLLRLKGRELETVRFLPAPRRAGAAAPVDLHRLDVGDLDGDGLDDIILGVHDPELQPGFTVIHRQRSDGSFGVASLAGFRPVALVEVDGDPAAELVARTTVATLSQETWLLGAGAEATPPLQVAGAPQSAPPPALTDRLLASAWQRAEQLAALGLSSEAARALDDLAGLLPDEPRAVARLRAAELHEAAGDHLAAAERFEQLGEQTGALLGAAHAYEQAGRFADALRVARLLAERADLPRSEAAHVRDRVAQLAAIVEDVDVIALRFDQPLPSPWQIDDPTAAHQDLVGQHLQIDAFAGRGPIARLPFEWSTGPLGLLVDLVLERGEWGSGLVVGVRPLGSPTLLSAVRIDISGGGGMFRRRYACQVGGAEEYILTQEPGEDPARPSHLHFALELLPELGQIACSAVVDGVRHERRTRLAADGLPPPGRYELVVMPSSFGTITGLWSSAKLRALTLRGARFGAAPTEEPPAAYAARLLVQGEAEAALAEARAGPGRRAAAGDLARPGAVGARPLGRGDRGPAPRPARRPVGARRPARPDAGAATDDRPAGARRVRPRLLPPVLGRDVRRGPPPRRPAHRARPDHRAVGPRRVPPGRRRRRGTCPQGHVAVRARPGLGRAAPGAARPRRPGRRRRAGRAAAAGPPRRARDRLRARGPRGDVRPPRRRPRVRRPRPPARPQPRADGRPHPLRPPLRRPRRRPRLARAAQGLKQHVPEDMPDHACPQGHSRSDMP
ncbi:FG-GAP-like repeat-containing protein [Nannocystis pusilla]|uniref:FG-GAP-like repeat-containing protein n=1 Tax=Nannocystis pusilla TaxID=889268 RepID=UPI003DA61A6D